MAKPGYQFPGTPKGDKPGSAASVRGEMPREGKLAKPMGFQKLVDKAKKGRGAKK